MASVYSATTEGEEALPTTAETVIALIGAAAVKAKLVQWSISFDSTSATAEPVRVRLLRTTLDDGTATAATEKPYDPDNPTANCAAKHSYTAEPTKETTPLEEYLVHPQSGVIVQYPLGREPTLDNVATAGLALEVLAPAAVNATATLVWEE